jgi:2-polyprenyl-3-methyl-5-hydroxy-6-metoxy-1,4-benzoquinol methylase
MTTLWNQAESSFIGIVPNHEITSPRHSSQSSFQRRQVLVAASSSPSSSSSKKGFGAAPKKTKIPSKKQVLKQLEKTYGGTTPQDIARGTQKRIEATMKSQPPHMQMALQIYQQLQQWNYKLNGMDLLQRGRIPQQDMEGGKRAQAELERLMNDHDFDERDVHNLLQQATWDASADAKAARSITGDMPKDLERRVQAGCAIVADAIGDSGKVLDVGCGFGVLVPYLKKAGVSESQIVGIDLSPEMIRNAQSFHPACTFEAADFFRYSNNANTNNSNSPALLDAVMFCSALHDLPDMSQALAKAHELLNVGGTLVILHAQGASHVQNQVRSNPVLVRRGLPTTEELKAVPGMRLLQEPAPARSIQEEKEGYLAVLQKV